MIDKIKKHFSNKDKCFKDNVTVAVEKKRRFEIVRKNNVSELICRIRIDGCLLTDNNIKKCDWLFVLEKSKVMIFVECKGENVLDAIEQLKSTICKFKPIITNSKGNYAYVIPSNVAPAFTSKISIAKQRFKKDYNCTLRIKNLTASHCI
jgi:hypothetical protein